MNLSRIFVIIALMMSVHPIAQASKKIAIDDETLNVLKDNYRIYNERNAKKMAQAEIAQAFLTQGHEKVLFQNLQTVVMPICDTQRPPFEWKYVAQSSDERVLKYIGDRELSARFLRWTDSIWIRIAGAQEKFREGMYCGEPLSDNPSVHNFVTIEIDKSFAENIRNRNTPADLIDGVVLQLATKYLSDVPHLMRGEVQLGVSASLKDTRFGIEIWSVGSDGAKMLSHQWHSTKLDASGIQTLKIEAQSEPGRQTHLILRLDPQMRDRAATGDVFGKVYLVDARLYPS